jgi:diguanylate cyclase (GGDEF)-like protein
MTRLDDQESMAELDQSSSESDQSAADVDQTASDSDQTSSERDQASADGDQRAADLDQQTSDAPGTQQERRLRYEQARQIRADSAHERDASAYARAHTASARDELARQRDALSAARDLVSAARDELAELFDAEIEWLEREQPHEEGTERNGTHVRLESARRRRLIAQSRAQAAAQREAAAEDRAQAARDRKLAAQDRLAYAREVANSELDEVTGALCRRVGLAALQREMDRTRRTGEQLTVVFIDVDGLKHVNDDIGHAAGDELLRTVVECITAEFRSYDLILRFGGDEFVCSLAGDGLEGIATRFERVSASLITTIAGATISTGVAQRRPEDTVESLIERADGAMIASRRNVTKATGS